LFSLKKLATIETTTTTTTTTSASTTTTTTQSTTTTTPIPSGCGNVILLGFNNSIHVLPDLYLHNCVKELLGLKLRLIIIQFISLQQCFSMGGPHSFYEWAAKLFSIHLKSYLHLQKYLKHL